MSPELLHLTPSEITALVVIAAVALVVSAFLGFLIGKRKERPMLGVVLGGLLTVPGLLAIALMPHKEPSYY